jgi:CBS domain-containing protein
MTPIARYKTLSQSLSRIRGSKFEVYLQGVDDMIMSLGSVLFEACNTSFQLHLQVNPNDFVNQHNWSQMIAGPVLSACVNSPLLFGNELWAETRIALFKQSLDTRTSQKYLRTKLPRVYFGRGWLKESPVELWKNDLMRFPLLVTSDDLKDSMALLKSGEIPDLRGIRLHNGTTYTWNRLCYGYSSKQPHLRIECRYLPSGPTAIDEIANFALWIGLMRCEPEGGVEFWKKNSFKAAKNNFILAARSGLNSVYDWYGKNISAKDLMLEKLIPMARQGLLESGVDPDHINKYLGVIQKRVEAEVTGSSWLIKNYRILSKKYGEVLAEKELVKQSIAYQEENIPLYQWKNMENKTITSVDQNISVDHLMSTDIYSVNENASIELILSILEWKNIHHLPVENDEGDLVGLITDGLVKRLNNITDHPAYAKDIMIKDFYTIGSQYSIKDAEQIMNKTRISGLPVNYQNKLVGMITLTDLQRFINSF